MCEVAVVVGITLLGVTGTKVAVAATGVVVNVAGVDIFVIAGSAGDIVFIRCIFEVGIACGVVVGVVVGVGVSVESGVGVRVGVGVVVGVGVEVGVIRQSGSGLHNKAAA